MNRNNNSIQANLPGVWAIVSTYDNSRGDWAQALTDLRVELNHYASLHGPVERLEGRWNGVEEDSLRLHGSSAFAQAQRIAREYNQDAFIYASGDGTAELWGRINGKYVKAAIYTTFERVDVERDTYDNASVLPCGLGFRLK